MKKIEITVQQGNMVQLPLQMVKQMQLREGDSVTIEYTPDRMADKCFQIEEDNEEAMFNEGYYCIPMRVMEDAGLKDNDIQVLLGKNEITITTTSNIIGILPTEFIGALIDQDVDLSDIADNVVERINDDVLESEEECI